MRKFSLINLSKKSLKSMVSLYVCDFPQSLQKEELSSIFESFDGYLETRTARDRSGQKIAFVDYVDKERAQLALQSCIGYRFQGAAKGITLRLSENSKAPNTSSNNKSPKFQKPPKSILKPQLPPQAPMPQLEVPLGSLGQI
jgi:hypothetical protein